MTRALVTLAIVLATSTAHAQPAVMRPGEFEPGRVEAEAPDVEILTFGVGDRIFEKFGHAAICLRYHAIERAPVCFNYGVTDFHEGLPMLWHFLRGEQKFWVEPTSYSSVTGFYRWEDRDIWSQLLPLTPAQARAIEDRLWSDIEPAHRYYVYDHFFDNCTTRLRDMIDAATGGKLRAGSDEPYPLTFREIGYRGLAGMAPLPAVADFVMGRQVDDHPTIWQAMFHPDIFRQMLEVKLGVKAELIYRRSGPPFPTTGATGRTWAFALALVFALPLVLAQWRRRGELLAVSWATLYLGVLGLVVWTLVIISSIQGVRWNEVVFVLMPLDLALPFLGKARRQRYARWRVIELLMISALCAVGVLHQPLWIPILTAVMPLAAIAFAIPPGAGGARSTS